jgi:hypothetical protein
MMASLKADQRALLDLRRARRNLRRMPARRDFDVLELRPWLGDLHMFEVVDGGKDFRYRIYATNIAIDAGREMTGKLMSETPEPHLRAIGLACYDEVRRAAVPYLIQRPTVIKTALGYDTIRDYLVLPLSDDGTVVDRLLVLNDSRARERATSSAIVFFPLEGDVGRY